MWFEEIKNFLWNNFTLIWAILGTIGTAYGYFINRRDKDLEVMPEFTYVDKHLTDNGRRAKLINETDNTKVKVIRLETKTPKLVANHTPLNMNIADNSNQFFIPIASRTGLVKVKIIFENKLRRLYVQEVTFNDDDITITRAKRYKKFLIFPQ